MKKNLITFFIPDIISSRNYVHSLSTFPWVYYPTVAQAKNIQSSSILSTTLHINLTVHWTAPPIFPVKVPFPVSVCQTFSFFKGMQYVWSTLDLYYLSTAIKRHPRRINTHEKYCLLRQGFILLRPLLIPSHVTSPQYLAAKHQGQKCKIPSGTVF